MSQNTNNAVLRALAIAVMAVGTISAAGIARADDPPARRSPSRPGVGSLQEADRRS